MQNYQVSIEEAYVKTFNILAESMEEAEELAKEGYEHGVYKMQGAALASKQIQIDDGEHMTLWREF